METSVVDATPVPAGTPQTTPAQVDHRSEISRQNGRKSRGPISQAGRERSRLNAVTHGLFARVIPAGQLPVFADRREYDPLVEQMLADFRATTSTGRALVESLALDLLRLRQVHSMEIALCDPGLDGDRDLEQAIRDRERASHRRSDEENDAMLQAYGMAAAQLRNGSRLEVPDEIVPMMTSDIWHAMNLDRDLLAHEREYLAETEAEMATADPAELSNLQDARTRFLETITQYEQDMQTSDRDAYLVAKESDVAAIVSGRKRIPPAMRGRWADLMERQRGALERDLEQVRNADLRIHRCRRRHLLSAAKKTEELNTIGIYEERVRRSISKTVALIKEVESGTTIDV